MGRVRTKGTQGRLGVRGKPTVWTVPSFPGIYICQNLTTVHLSTPISP